MNEVFSELQVKKRYNERKTCKAYSNRRGNCFDAKDCEVLHISNFIELRRANND